MKRILVVARAYPWPADSGGRMRVANTVKALLPLGDVDLFVAARGDDEADVAPAEPVRRIGVHRYPSSSLTMSGRIRWFAKAGLPLELVDRDFSGLREAFARFVDGQRYDLVWVSRIPTFVAVGRLPSAPTIVDVDDLRGDWHVRRLATSAGGSPSAWVRRQTMAASIRRNAAAWQRLQSEIATYGSAMLVCSEADRVRLAVSNSRVIPNGYEPPERPVGRPEVVGSPPTIVFQGGLSYPPNIDAATQLVRTVLPRLRTYIPDVEVRLVGSPAASVEALAATRGVTVTGHVPAIEDELRRADLVATPIRFGGGTRIKILEAFAHRIPVVSTSVGAYGLDAIDGQHLRIADSPDDFAAACAQLLVDTEQRVKLTAEAEALFLTSYQWGEIGGMVRELALAAMRHVGQPWGAWRMPAVDRSREPDQPR